MASLPATLQRFHCSTLSRHSTQWSKTHGSLLRGLRAGSKERNKNQAAKRHIFSFTRGMQMLPEALAAEFQSALQLSSCIRHIKPRAGQWEVTTEAGKQDTFDAVLSTLPLPAALPCLSAIEPDLQTLEAVFYPPVSVFALGFHKDDVQHPLDGFGMLVPGKEMGTRVLGTIFSSTVFPNRAPDGHVLLTTLVGGARKGDLCALSDELLLDFVLDDLHHMLGVSGNPVFSQKISWPHAIPQYNLGYGLVKARIDALEAKHKGLFFAGNYRNGISVGDAARSGKTAAQQIIAHFA